MDDDWGYPHFRKPPCITTVTWGAENRDELWWWRNRVMICQDRSWAPNVLFMGHAFPSSFPASSVWTISAVIKWTPKSPSESPQWCGNAFLARRMSNCTWTKNTSKYQIVSSFFSFHSHSIFIPIPFSSLQSYFTWRRAKATNSGLRLRLAGPIAGTPFTSMSRWGKSDLKFCPNLKISSTNLGSKTGKTIQISHK